MPERFKKRVTSSPRFTQQQIWKRTNGSFIHWTSTAETKQWT